MEENKIVKIAPSILSSDFLHLYQEIKQAEQSGVHWFHLDIMDGHFVPNITIGPMIVAAIKKATNLPLDVHLMIENPDKSLKDFINAGADYLTVHKETTVHLHRTIQFIKEHNIKAGVSLNPATSIHSIEDILPDIDLVLVMSVNPGFGGQAFIPLSIDKIKALKQKISDKRLNTLIEVDGGVKIENAKAIVDAGADILVMGSAFFGSGDYKQYMDKLRRALQD